MGKKILLIGKPGLSMLADALKMSKEILGTENLSIHPDYLFVEPVKKATLGVEEAKVIEQKAHENPAVAKSVVIVVNGLDKMTEQGQNKLLKTFEESKRTTIISVCYSDKILATVRSRCEVRTYRPLSLEKFRELVPGNATFYYSMTGGCPGLIKEMQDVEENFRKASEVIKSNNEKDLLSAWNLVKEKDPKAITATPWVKQAILFMEECYVDRLGEKDNADTIARIRRLDQEAKAVEKVSYSKDDFFLLIADLITLPRKGGM